MRKEEISMTTKTKAKRKLLAPKYPPDSFTRAELLKAIKEIAAARVRRPKLPVANGSK
jgi:hypothetical protein